MMASCQEQDINNMGSCKSLLSQYGHLAVQDVKPEHNTQGCFGSVLSSMVEFEYWSRI